MSGKETADMETTVICYFSGTGNSLQVARELARRIPGAELVPVMASLKQEAIEIPAQTVGFVFPLHAFSVPLPVKEFLKKLRLPNATHLFAIATRGGSPCRVFRHIDKYLSHTGKRLDASCFIDMPNNYLLSFDLPAENVITSCEPAMLSRVETMASAIQGRKQLHEKDPHSNFLLENIVYPAITAVGHLTRYGGLEHKLYADAKCTGCGVCAQVCPADKIAMKNGQPVWQKGVECTFCFACIHYCPARAVQVKGYKTAEKGRYVHPKVSVADIAGQKK